MDKLTVLKRRLSPAEGTDELLSDLLSDAELYVMAYTGRGTVPPELEGTVVELAAIQYNRLGMQGEGSHQEGSVSITMENLPQSIRLLLNRFRLARVVG